MADHYLDGFVKGALEEEAAGKVGGEEAVDDGAVGEAAVGGSGDLFDVCDN